MDTTQLTHALREATEAVEPRQGFAAAVLRGGRRRKTRRRLVLATGAATVTAVAASSTYVLVSDPATRPEASGVDQPAWTPGGLTTGGVAPDPELAAKAIKAWQEGLPRSWNADRGIFDDLRGQPRVHWAGDTPAGAAAVVMQEAFLHPHDNLGEDDFNTTQTLVGLVAKDPVDGVLRLVDDQYQPKESPPPGTFQFGQGDRTILVVDHGTPLFFSPAPLAAPDGRITRDWQPMKVTDGVTIAQLPEGADPADARVLARKARPAPDDKNFEGLLSLWPSSAYMKFAKTGKSPTRLAPAADNRLGWFEDAARDMRVGGTVNAPADIGVAFSGALERFGYTDLAPAMTAHGLWQAVAGLPDGRTALLGELQEQSKPSRIFAVLLKPDGSVDRVIAAGKVDKAATLPVKVRMPDGQGWVVADYGAALRYRTSPSGQWLDAGRNAALLPDNAVQVEVVKDAAAPKVADLGK